MDPPTDSIHGETIVTLQTCQWNATTNNSDIPKASFTNDPAIPKPLFHRVACDRCKVQGHEILDCPDTSCQLYQTPSHSNAECPRYMRESGTGNEEARSIKAWSFVSNGTSLGMSNTAPASVPSRPVQRHAPNPSSPRHPSPLEPVSWVTRALRDIAIRDKTKQQQGTSDGAISALRKKRREEEVIDFERDAHDEGFCRLE